MQLELISLSRRINDREEVIESMCKRTLASVNETLCEVLLQGQDLIEMKARLPHGHWINWLRAHCPKLSIRRAQRYMALASRAPVTAHLTEADSLRAALALCDLEGHQQHQDPKRWPAYLEAISRLSKLRAYVENNPIIKWPDEGLARFRVEFEPIAQQLWPDKFTAAP